LPLEPVEPLGESPAVGPAAPAPCDLGSAVRPDDGVGDEAPLDAEGLLALALGELTLGLESDEPLTPKAASACRSS